MLQKHLYNFYFSLFSNSSLSFQVANKRIETNSDAAKKPRNANWYLATYDWKITVNKKLRNKVIRILEPMRSTNDFSILSIILGPNLNILY